MGISRETELGYGKIQGDKKNYTLGFLLKSYMTLGKKLLFGSLESSSKNGITIPVPLGFGKN